MSAEPNLADPGTLDGVTPARQARSRIAQERLLEAAEEVFANKGYHGAHITEIASAAGYSTGTLYLRFRDKDALFRALRRRYATRGRENIDRFFDLPRWSTDSPTRLIQTYIVATSRLMARNAGFFRAHYQRSLAGESAADWPELRDASRKAATRLASFLRERAPECAREDLEALCRFCLNAVEGTIVHSLLNENPDDRAGAPDFLNALVLMTTACLGLPPAEPLPAAPAAKPVRARAKGKPAR